MGYAGGSTEHPTYRSMGDHSEVVRIEFDPQVIGYPDLLEIFWDSHDPTFDAFSRQYRRAVFTYGATQQKQAETSLEAISSKIEGPIFTVIEPAGPFYPAEDYHQKYLLRRAESILRELQVVYPDPSDLAASTAAARVNGYLGCNGQPELLSHELGQLGLSPRAQAQLVEYVSRNCSGFSGLTCPSRE